MRPALTTKILSPAFPTIIHAITDVFYRPWSNPRVRSIGACLVSFATLNLASVADGQQLIGGFTAMVEKHYADSVISFDFSGDINNDGRNDAVIFGKDGGSGTKFVRVRDFVTGDVLLNIPSLNISGDNRLAVGDVNGDGFDDVVLSEPGANNGSVYDVGEIFVYSGQNGALLFSFYGDYEYAQLGTVLHVSDLTGDGRAEILAASKDSPYSDPEMPPYLVVRSGAPYGEICRFESLPDEVGGQISAVYAGPDFNGDGKSEILLGAPFYDAAGGSDHGALFVLDGMNCDLLGVIEHPQPNAKFGESITRIADRNGDDQNDFIVITSGSDLLFSGTDGTLIEEVPVSGSYSATGDLNLDGVPDYAAADPSDDENIVLYSGGSGNVIGLIRGEMFEDSFKQIFGPESRYWELRFGAGVRTNYTVDVDNDGIADIVSVLNEFDIGANDATLVLVFAGACPITPHVSLHPQNEWKVPIGPTRIQAEASVCGIAVPTTFEAKIGGLTVPLFDNGQGGDVESGDGQYSGTVPFTAGLNQLSLHATLDNEVVIPFDETINVVGVENYSVATVPYEWESVDDAAAISSLIGQSGFAEVQLPFPIDFYGKFVAKVYPSTVGLIGIEAPSIKKENERLPSLALESGYIAPLWDALVPTAGARIYTKTMGTPGTRRFIITWEGYEFQMQNPPQQGEASQVTFQAVFFEGSNIIRFNYKRVFSTVETKNKGSSATAGIQVNSLLGKTFMHAEPILADGTAVEIRPPTPTPTPTPAPTAPPGGTTPEQPTPSYLVKMAVKFAAKKKTAIVTLTTFDASSGAVAPLSDSSCKINLYGGEADKGTSVETLPLLGSIPAGSGSRSVTVKNLKPIAPAKVSGKSRKKVSKVGLISANLECVTSKGTSPRSPAVTMKLGPNAKGAVRFNSWVKKLTSGVQSSSK